MISKSMVRCVTVLLSLILLLGSTASGFQGKTTALAGVSAVTNNYLPITWKTNPWSSLFGVEITSWFTSDAPVLHRALLLPTKWVRLNQRISWRQLQPNEGGLIQWALLANFENELRALKAAYITPIVVVDDYPAWATTERTPGIPSYCGPMRADKYAAFANFAGQLATRYKTSEFNVHIWELGNEPDVDGTVYNLPIDSQYGCWGVWSDPYYGGEAYGDMLKVVTPAIKTADPLAQVWVGGLLLNSPLTTEAGEGHPELFLQGVLEAAVGNDFSYFDVVPYHAYSLYNNQNIDYDNGDTTSPWYGDTWGGAIRGKARFLTAQLTDYGVQKPLFVGEVSFGCPQSVPVCASPTDAFFQMQASHLVRMQARGASEGVSGFLWYSLDDPGWRFSGLLDAAGAPRPSYLAYQVLAQQLINSEYLAPVADYGTNVEAYAFTRGDQVVHVVWTKLDVTGVNILVPAGNFVEARTRDGAVIAPVLVSGNYQIPVGFSPVYVIRNP